MPVGEGAWQLGKTDLNFLVLGVVKPGNSDTDERIALMTRFLHVFRADRMGVLLADREFFFGECWFRLQQHRIPFHQRLKHNTLISQADENRPVRLDALFHALKPGQHQHLRAACGVGLHRAPERPATAKQ